MVRYLFAFILCLLVGGAQAQWNGCGTGFCSPAPAGTGGGLSYTVTGPTTGVVDVTSTNFTVTISSGAFTGTEFIYVNDGGAGGTLTPSTGSAGLDSIAIAPPSGTSSFTFTYLPSGIGAITLTFTNGQSWPDVSPRTYTSTVQSNGAVATTYDPINKGNDVVLSNGNLTATTFVTGGGTGENERSTCLQSSGKSYQEFTINSVPQAGISGIFLFISNPSEPTTEFASLNAVYAFGVSGGATNWGQGSTVLVQAWASLQVGDTIGIALDATNKLVWAVVMHAGGVSSWNGSFTSAQVAAGTGGAPLASPLTPPYLPFTGSGTDQNPANGNTVWTANFAGPYLITANGGTVPSGFTECLTSPYTASGPASGLDGVASTNFTVAVDGKFNGAESFTISDGSQGGTITPSIGSAATNSVTVTPASGTSNFTFTYTPAIIGNVTLTFTNGQSWVNPLPLVYASKIIPVITPPATSVVAQSPATTFSPAPVASEAHAPGGETYTVTVSDANDILRATGSGTVTGSGTTSLTIAGTLANVNNSLATLTAQGPSTLSVAPNFVSNGDAQPLTDYPTAGGAFYDPVDNQTWVAYTGYNGSTVTYYVTVYSHATGVWSTPVAVGISSVVTPNDADAGPGIIMDQYGFVHVFYGAHDTELFYSITTNPRDPTAWTAGTAITLESSGFTYVSPVLVKGQIWVVTTSRPTSAQDIVIFGGTPSATGAPIATWFGPQQITNFSTVFGAWAGNLIVNSNQICFPFTAPAISPHEGVFYGCYNTSTGAFGTINGSTVIGSGSLPITLATAQADFTVSAWPGGSNSTVIPSQAIDPNGITHVLYSTGSGNNFPLFEAYFSGGAWTTGVAISTGFATNDTFQPTIAPTWNGVQVWWGQSSNFPTTVDNAMTSVSTTLGTWSTPVQFLAATNKYLSMYTTVANSQALTYGSVPFPVIFSEADQGGSDTNLRLWPYNGSLAISNDTVTFNIVDSSGNVGVPATTQLLATPWDGTVWNNPPGPGGLVTHGSFVSPSTKATIGYNVYLPPSYATGSNFPVVYFLHGQTGNENDDPTNAPTVMQTELNSLITAATVQPMIVVWPNGGLNSKYMDPMPTTLAYSNYLGEQQILEVIRYIDKTYRTNPTQAGRAIQGFSMGGLGCERIGFKYPQLFSSIYCIAPAIDDNSSNIATNEPALYADAFGSNAQAFQNNTAQNVVTDNAQAVQGTPITVVIGSTDPLLSVNQTQNTLLSNLGIVNTLTTVSGCGHDLTCDLSTSGTPNGANWIFANSNFNGGTSQVITIQAQVAPDSAYVPPNYQITFNEEFPSLNVFNATPGPLAAAPVQWYNGNIQCCIEPNGGLAGNGQMYPVPGPLGAPIYPFSLDASGGADVNMVAANGFWNDGMPTSEASACSNCSTSINNDFGGPTFSYGGGFNQKYGFFEAVMQVPPQPGVWPSFWMFSILGACPGGVCTHNGEIDIIEYYGSFKNSFCSTIHDWTNTSFSTGSCSGTSVQYPFRLQDAYHSYNLLWTANNMVFGLDNNINYQHVPLDIPNGDPNDAMGGPYYLIFGNGLGGGFPTTNTTSPSVLKVKHIRVYQRTLPNH